MMRFLKEPGSIRILAGSITVLVLLILAIFGESLLKYSPSEMDSENIMSPPSIGLFRAFLITDKGLENLGLKEVTPAAGEQTQVEEQDEDLNYLDEDTNDPDVSEGVAEEKGETEKEDSEESESPEPEPGESPSEEYSEEDEGMDYLAEDDSESAETSGSNTDESENGKDAGGSDHLFGTDKDGRDILSLIVAGAKTCILPGLLACLVALGLGIPMGILGGYYGGKIAGTVQMFNGIMLSFPRFVLILVVICALEPNVYYTMIVLGLTIVPRISELMRTRVGMLSKLGFILAAKESGLSDLKIMARHLFWYSNRTIFFIQASLVMAESILVETTLSYLQFGTKAPDVSWGNIIEGSRMSFFSEYYWITFFPAVAIVISILGFYYLGDGMNARMEYNERR